MPPSRWPALRSAVGLRTPHPRASRGNACQSDPETRRTTYVRTLSRLTVYVLYTTTRTTYVPVPVPFLFPPRHPRVTAHTYVPVPVSVRPVTISDQRGPAAVTPARPAESLSTRAEDTDPCAAGLVPPRSKLALALHKAGVRTYSCSERLVGRTAPSPRGRWAAPLLLPEHRKAHLPLLHT